MTTAYAILWDCGRLGLCLAPAMRPDGTPGILVTRCGGGVRLPIVDQVAAHVVELHAILTADPDRGRCWLCQTRAERAAAAAAPVLKLIKGGTRR